MERFVKRPKVAGIEEVRKLLCSPSALKLVNFSPSLSEMVPVKAQSFTYKYLRERRLNIVEGIVELK
jgi:hypothetical protein